jgi:hypothetical protein
MSMNQGSPRAPGSLIVASTVLWGLLASTPAFAWNFDEHSELGSKGYRAACEQLAHDLHIDVAPDSHDGGGGDGTPHPCVNPKSAIAVRWCLACRTFSPALYGQSVAIAGDHVGSPDELMSAEGQMVAANVVDYTFLALVNAQHFHPAAPRNWRAFHDQALGLATKGYPDGPIAHEFAQIFYTSAYADHFLQDAFSAGHAGFNRPSTGAVASKAFHDIWNRAGRLVRSPTGSCWLQYGDGKLKYSSPAARFHIDQAEKASVFDVLAAFMTGTRDSQREILPVYYMPSEITSNPLPGYVWATSGADAGAAPLKAITGGKAETASPSSKAWAAPPDGPPKVQNPEIIERIYEQQSHGLYRGTCVVEMVPIDGISNPAMINGGIDFWAVAAGDGQLKYGSLDVLYNHRLASFMSLPFSWEGGLGIGYLQREGANGWAPSAILGVLAPPLYLIHGLWRNELGAQTKGYLATGSPQGSNGYASLFLRSSLEVATMIVRLQAGPTVDFRTGRFGLGGALGLEFSGTRWVTGGGSLVDF